MDEMESFLIYHLESRWLNSHVLVYHIPLLSLATFWGWIAIYFPDGIDKNKTTSGSPE